MSEPRSLVILSDGTRMLAEASTFDDYKNISDLAVAAAAYAKAHRLGKEAQGYAVEIAAIALRRMAELDPPVPNVGGPSRSGLADRLDIPKQRRSENRDLLELTEEELKAEVRSQKDPSLSRTKRKARDKKAKKQREQKAAVAVLPPSCDLRLGDFRDVLSDIPDGSLDLILTDPPYPEEYLPLWSDLATFAQAKLKPTGLLAAMSGQVHLPAVMNMLGGRLTYRWVIAYLMPGQANVVHARRVSTQWKPVLVYGPNERRFHDVVDSETGDKAHHEWGQSESGMANLLRQLADPGDLVCDPFVGGGTTALVALDHGCSFIGAELDPDAHETALVRLAA